MQRNEPDEPTLCKGGTERLLSLATEYLKSALRIESQFLADYRGDGNRAIDSLRSFTEDSRMSADIESYWRPFREVHAAVAAISILKSQHDLASAMSLAMEDGDRVKMRSIASIANTMSKESLETTLKVERGLEDLSREM